MPGSCRADLGEPPEQSWRAAHPRQRRRATSATPPTPCPGRSAPAAPTAPPRPDPAGRSPPRSRAAHPRCRAVASWGPAPDTGEADGGSPAVCSVGSSLQSGLAFRTAARMSESRRAVEEPAPGQHLPHHHPEGPDVGAPVHPLPPHLLRAHVGRSAHHHARPGRRRRHGPGVGLALCRRRRERSWRYRSRGPWRRPPE